MEAVREQKQSEFVHQLCHAVDGMVEAIGSGRVGFDHAVYEYVSTHDTDLAVALQYFLDVLQDANLRCQDENLGEERKDEVLAEARRTALRAIADGLAVPELTEFVNALIESQDKHISLLATLKRQAGDLHRKVDAG